MNKSIKIVFSTLVVIGILLISIFAVTTKQEIDDINEVIEKVEDQPLSVRILADTSSGTLPLIVNFKPLLLNSKNQVEYYWEFGDGNTSNEEEPVYIYKDKGTFSCQLTVTDGDIKISDGFNVTVFPNNPPKIKILCETTVNRPVKVTFDVEAFDPEGEELEYRWTLIYPQYFGYQKEETYNTKSFTKRFLRNGPYTAKLIVTDEAGNEVTDYENIQVQKHQLEQFVGSIQGIILFQLPLIGSFLWKLPFIQESVSNYLDEHWLNWSSGLQKLISTAISLMNIDYEPPIPKADLEWVPETININLSAYVNDTGVVQSGASVRSSFVLMNNDSSNIAKSVYITLDKPFSDKKGLNDTIEVENLSVALDVCAESNTLFYNGEYTNWENSYYIEKLAPGDYRELGITVRLKEGATFTKDSYLCHLYIYQEKYLDEAEYIDEIPFTIIL